MVHAEIGLKKMRLQEMKVDRVSKKQKMNPEKESDLVYFLHKQMSEETRTDPTINPGLDVIKMMMKEIIGEREKSPVSEMLEDWEKIATEAQEKIRNKIQMLQ